MGRNDRYRQCVILIIIGLMLSACQRNTSVLQSPSSLPVKQPSASSIPDPTPPPNPTIVAWEHAWLDSSPCAPPCWQTLTPGISTITDMLTLVQAQPWIDDIENEQITDTDTPSTTMISWYTKHSSGFAVAPTFSYTINLIRLTPTIPFAFHDIQRAFGNPDYVTILQYPIIRHNMPPDEPLRYNYQMYFIYPQHGFEVIAESSTPQFTFDTSLTFRLVYFFPVHEPFDLSLIYETRRAAVIPWTEGKPLRWYCRKGSDYTQPCTNF